ncbi:MAG: sialate O-acetylesterase [Pseudomonadota bacterium]
MAKPVFILAGQSNVGTLSNEIEDALDERYGEGNYQLVKVFSPGAPITRARPDKPDWYNEDELQAELSDKTLEALTSDPNSVVGGVLWIQGEADTFRDSAAQKWGEKFEALIDDFRDDVAAVMGPRDIGLSNAPVSILELSENAPDADGREGWDTIIDEQRGYAAEHSSVYTVDPDKIANFAGVGQADMFKDGLHYAPEFSEELAEELVATLPPASEFDLEESAGNGAGAPVDLPIDDPIDDQVDAPTDEPDTPLGLPVVDPVDIPDEIEEESVEADDGGFDFDGAIIGLLLLPLLAAAGLA